MNTLLVDAGNTRIKWREATRTHGLESRSTTGVARLADDFRAPASSSIDRAVVSCAVVSCVAGPAVMVELERALRSAWPAIAISRITAEAEACGVVNGYAEPGRLGADRWAALIGAHAGWPRIPLLVCGFGTATTLDLLLPVADDRAHFAGGFILPGSSAMRQALATTTAGLDAPAGHAVAFATRTEDAIDSGILMAQLGAVQMAIAAAERVLKEKDIAEPLTCLFAGGDAETIACHWDRGTDVIPGVPVPVVHLVPDLVLKGIAALALRRQSGSA